ncbi:MAG: hypothetical protein JRJ62_00090 [Deltaproteobacteria bacterium]|nr:hypothetical protein [Deltaproteobacteria bacterium]
MHNRDKYPAIWAEKERAEKELKPLFKERKVHTDEMAVLQHDIQVLQERKQALNEKAMKDTDQIMGLRDTVSRMARAMGAVVAGS